MTDIVERLRSLVILDEVGSDNPLGREAADEIERLRTENKRLRMLAMEGRSVHGGWPDVADEGAA